MKKEITSEGEDVLTIRTLDEGYSERIQGAPDATERMLFPIYGFVYSIGKCQPGKVSRKVNKTRNINILLT